MRPISRQGGSHKVRGEKFGFTGIGMVDDNIRLFFGE